VNVRTNWFSFLWISHQIAPCCFSFYYQEHRQKWQRSL
jgi:hypothetical protein